MRKTVTDEAKEREAEELRHLCLVEMQQQPHLHGGHVQRLVRELQLRPAQPRPLQSPVWPHVQGRMVLTWESVEGRSGDNRANEGSGLRRACSIHQAPLVSVGSRAQHSQIHASSSVPSTAPLCLRAHPVPSPVPGELHSRNSREESWALLPGNSTVLEIC